MGGRGRCLGRCVVRLAGRQWNVVNDVNVKEGYRCSARALAVACAFISPPLSSRRGEALWEREVAWRWQGRVRPSPGWSLLSRPRPRGSVGSAWRWLGRLRARRAPLVARLCVCACAFEVCGLGRLCVRDGCEVRLCDPFFHSTVCRVNVHTSGVFSPPPPPLPAAPEGYVIRIKGLFIQGIFGNKCWSPSPAPS